MDKWQNKINAPPYFKKEQVSTLSVNTQIPIDKTMNGTPA